MTFGITGGRRGHAREHQLGLNEAPKGYTNGLG
jgi:hypothetical protein